ncbi:MAG: Tn3 family transposase, partial [Acidobacteria bacterium]|nr:Tn3 family transposase [Acidobacteriota bacterium]
PYPHIHPRNRRTRRPDRPRLTLNEGQGVQVTTIIGFAFTELLGFKLLPRLKNIGSIRLYSPDDAPGTALEEQRNEESR